MTRLSRLLSLGFAAVLLPVALSAQDQKKSAEVSTPAGKFSLDVTAEYLGMASGKTVVRLRLSSPQLSKALTARGVRFVSGELRGSFSRGEQMVEAFRYPVSGDIDGGRTFAYSFLRSVAPGAYKVEWWDTHSQGVLQSDALTAGGDTIKLPVPAFDRDLAFKVIRQNR